MSAQPAFTRTLDTITDDEVDAMDTAALRAFARDHRAALSAATRPTTSC